MLYCIVQGFYVTGRGVPGSGGVDIGTVQLMLKARPLQGMRVDPKTGARRKVSLTSPDNYDYDPSLVHGTRDKPIGNVKNE